MTTWVFIAGTLMTAFAGRTYGFWEGFASGALTVASTILVYHFIDKNEKEEED